MLSFAETITTIELHLGKNEHFHKLTNTRKKLRLSSQNKNKGSISISKPSTFYCFVYAELCCLSAFYNPAAVVQNLLSKKCVWDNRKKVKGRKKRMAQNWELKYNTGENKDFRSLARYDLAVESRYLSQADKSIIRVSSFPKLFLNDRIYSYTKKTIWHLSILSFKNLQHWKVLSFQKNKFCYPSLSLGKKKLL